MATVKDHQFKILGRLKLGTDLVKVKSDGRQISRQFFLDGRENFISYTRSHKPSRKPNLYFIKDIDEIRTGFNTQTFNQLVKKDKIKSIDEKRCFSIFYDNHRKEEHFIAPSIDIKDLWVNGLQCLIDRHGQRTQYDLIREQSWILNFFHSADKNRSNTLTKKECYDLLIDSFHIKIPNHTFEQIFNKIPKKHSTSLNPQEFVNFFHLLTRRKDLYEIMNSYTNQENQLTIENISMNKHELLEFLRQNPNQNIRNIDNFERIQDLINEFEVNKELRNNGLLSLDGFRNMLLSEKFDIIQSSYSRQIYQDMTRPLCDYYINTSHNTYLFYSQVYGESNPEAYNRVLLMGGRAVEFDCYDGDDGQPIVKHAFTLVKPCTFESIIHCIEPNLFKVSPYPVILNIENHCSSKQQKQMARILKTILGDRLITKPLPTRDPKILPSPEDLKYKVLIRSKNTSKSDVDSQVDKRNTSSLNGLNQTLENIPVDSKDFEPELSEFFIYFQNVPYREYDYAKNHYSAFHSSSLSENEFLNRAKADPVGLVQQTTWRLLRLYPGGVRQDSSNPDPTLGWNFGLQMAALNYQTTDDMMALNYGKFLDNGSCGYILKPNYLINAHETNFNPWDCPINLDFPINLTIKIISGQFLPRSSLKTSDIPDPYIRISTHGLSCDQYTEKTEVIDDNGLDPIWNETFNFRIRFPQMCLIYFSVMDYDSSSADDRMAYFCSPVNMIQTGYRHIHLRANNNDQIHSTLFVHIEKRNEILNGKIITSRF